MTEKLLVICTLAFAFAGALDTPPPSETFTPENFSQLESVSQLESDQDEFSLVQNTVNKKGKSACAKMADSTKKSVRNAAKNLQKQLDSFNKDRACAKKGQSAVKQAQRELADAKQHVKRMGKEYRKAQDTPINYGTHKFKSIKKGNCNAFFRSYNYKKAEKKVSISKKTLTAAKTRLANAKRSLKTAIVNAKRLRNKCYCNARKAFVRLFKTLSRRLVTGQTGSWNRAHFLLCVLKGTAQKNCRIAPLPKLTKKMQVLTSSARKARCIPGTYVGMGTSSTQMVDSNARKTRSYYNKQCSTKYGSGAYWCQRKDLMFPGVSKFVPANTWIPVSDFYGTGKYYNGNFLCSHTNGNEWAAAQYGPTVTNKNWSFRCNGQYPPCCKKTE